MKVEVKLAVALEEEEFKVLDEAESVLMDLSDELANKGLRNWKFIEDVEDCMASLHEILCFVDKTRQEEPY